MAELNDHQEPTLSTKRKPDPAEDPPNKTPKLATLDHKETEEQNHNSGVPSTTNCSSEPNDVPNEGNDNGNELENDDEFDEDEDEDEDDEAEVDRKGKGVLRDDKGKGKLIEEEDDEDDSDSDDDDDGSVSGDDSDFSDDPLAEVDLNNILPSRTRRRTTQPGLHIASDMANAGEDDDDSDDSDA